jgi:hypothetical protein
MARKVHAAYTEFQQLLQDWGRISEGAYHQLVGGGTDAVPRPRP